MQNHIHILCLNGVMGLKNNIDSFSAPLAEKETGSIAFKALFFILGTYLVLILSIILTIFIGAGLIYIFYEWFSTFTNSIPSGLMVVLGLGMVIGVLSMLHGIYVSLKPRKSFYPGYIIAKEEQPVLATLIEKLCRDMGTDSPDTIILHAEPTFFVQHGKVVTFNGKGKGKILSIGIPLLSYLTVDELRSILAHEFAHFTGKDTTYSTYIAPAYESAITAIRNMQSYINRYLKKGSGKQAALILPMLLPNYILKLYFSIFHKSNMKRSRHRELRADSIAAATCGSDSFKSALKKVVGLSKVFEDIACGQLLGLYREGRQYKNYYQYFKEMSPYILSAASKFTEDALKENTNKYDSHPSLKDRLERFPETGMNCNDNEASTELINDLEKYEKYLTQAYTEYLAVLNNVRF